MHYIKKLSYAVLAYTLASTSVAIADTAKPQLIKKKTDPVAIKSYWTPERMRQATAMDLPMADPQRIKLSFDELMQKQKGKPSDVHLGHPPVTTIAPDTHPLFEPIRSTPTVSKMDTGRLNEYFSSQALVPSNADQSYPYMAIGKLFFVDTNGNPKTCSASVVANRLILTAGHCAHNGNGSPTGWYHNWLFVPAYHNGTAPFQSWAPLVIGVADEWYVSNNQVPNAHDYAILMMADEVINNSVQMIGNIVGVLGYKTYSTIPNHAHLIGYPDNLDGGQLMHQVTAQSAVAVSPNNAEYGSDMSLGSGGGPWIQNFGPVSAGQTGGIHAERNMIIGLSSYGYNDAFTLAEGSPILDSTFSSDMSQMCALEPQNC